MLFVVLLAPQRELSSASAMKVESMLCYKKFVIMIAPALGAGNVESCPHFSDASGL